MAGNKKSFDLRVVYSKTFPLILSTFDYAVTFLFRIRNKISITFVSQLISNFITIINLKRIRILASGKLIGKQTQTINLKRVRLVISTKAIGKILSTIRIKKLMTFVSTARQKVLSSIVIKKIKFGFTAILATFFTLADHDPSALSVMDVQTLADLDYTES